MKGLNLSKFKKYSDEKDFTSLVHKDGHIIRIAKAPLSHLQRKQLESLEMHQPEKMAFGGTFGADPYAGETQSTSPVLDRVIDSIKTPATPARTVDQRVEDRAKERGVIAQVLEQNGKEESAAPRSGAERVEAAEPTIQPEPVMQEAAQPPKTEQQVNAPPKEHESRVSKLEKDLASFETQAQIIKRFEERDKTFYDEFKNKQINRNHYWENHSPIAAGIGVLISSLGQVVGAGKVPNNAALELINKGIDQDIELQKSAKNDALTLWKMNREALGNELQANLVTKNQMLAMTKLDIEESAAAAKGAKSLAQARLANHKIDQEISINNQRLALMNPSAENSDPASLVPLLVPESRQQKVIDEINSAKYIVDNQEGILEAFDLAANDARPLTGGFQTSPSAFSPNLPFIGGYKTAGQKALQARLAPTFQRVEGTVRQAAMDSLDKNVTPKFGDSDFTVKTKRNSLIQYLKSNSSEASAAKSFGIDLSKFPTTNTDSIGQPKYKISGGKKYIRGPNGEAIEVK